MGPPPYSKVIEVSFDLQENVYACAQSAEARSGKDCLMSIGGLDPQTGDFLYAASIEGTLSLSNGTLSGTLPVHSQTAPPTFDSDAFIQYTYDQAIDTLVDNFGVVWSH